MGLKQLGVHSASLKEHFLFLILALILAQAPSPTPTLTPGPATAPLTVSWPTRIEISASSATHFAGFNHDGFGSIIVSVNCDGSKSPIIPPTPDIDADLKAALMRFLEQTSVTAGSRCQPKVYIVRFEVPSGSVTEIELPPPRG